MDCFSSFPPPPHRPLQLYGNHNSLNKWVFWKATLDAVLHSSVAFFVTILVLVSFSGDTNTGTNDISDLDSVGNVLFTAVLSVITMEIVLDTRSWTVLHLGKKEEKREDKRDIEFHHSSSFF